MALLGSLNRVLGGREKNDGPRFRRRSASLRRVEKQSSLGRYPDPAKARLWVVGAGKQNSRARGLGKKPACAEGSRSQHGHAHGACPDNLKIWRDRHAEPKVCPSLASGCRHERGAQVKLTVYPELTHGPRLVVEVVPCSRATRAVAGAAVGRTWPDLPQARPVGRVWRVLNPADDAGASRLRSHLDSRRLQLSCGMCKFINLGRRRSSTKCWPCGATAEPSAAASVRVVQQPPA